MKPIKNAVKYKASLSIPVTVALENEIRIKAAVMGISKAQLCRDGIEFYLEYIKDGTNRSGI